MMSMSRLSTSMKVKALAGAGGAAAILALSAAPAFAATPTITSPTGTYTAVDDANGNPIGADLTVTASGFTPFQPVYAVVCDGKSPSDPTFSVGIDCDLGSAPAPFGASSSGTVTFGDTPGTNHNFVIHLFRGVSPQDQFNCLAPGDDPTATSVTVTNPSDASQVATIDPADPSYGQTGTSPCVIRLSTSETTKQSTDLYIPYTIPQNPSAAPASTPESPLAIALPAGAVALFGGAGFILFRKRRASAAA